MGLLRFYLANEIVTTALYLASPASSYTTGALIRVDTESGEYLSRAKGE